MRISDWSSDVCSSDLLRKDATYVKVNGKSISDVVLMPLDIALAFFQQLELTENEAKIAKRLLTEIGNRLQFLTDVGLSYLTLNRLSNTLSGEIGRASCRERVCQYV